jgi:hypothetical protein
MGLWCCPVQQILTYLLFLLLAWSSPDQVQSSLSASWGSFEQFAEAPERNVPISS